MTKTSKHAILGAAAKELAWRLYSDAGYCRVREPVNVERFSRELLSAAGLWKATHKNLTTERRRTNGTPKA